MIYSCTILRLKKLYRCQFSVDTGSLQMTPLLVVYVHGVCDSVRLGSIT